MTKHNGTRYSAKRKAEMINRMTAPNNESVADISIDAIKCTAIVPDYGIIKLQFFFLKTKSKL